MSTEQLVAGDKLDRRVAKAAGWNSCCDWEETGLGNFYGCVYQCRVCGEIDLVESPSELDMVCLPCFSTDLNAAFEAAERTGLFDKNRFNALLEKTTDGRWEVLWSTDDISVEADTPALAICGAILKLLGK